MPSHSGCYSQSEVDGMREEFEEKLRKQREEMTAEMMKEMNAKIQDLMASVCVPGNFQQVLLGGDFHQAIRM
ncbi:hypothetical protein GCM10007860_35640 [Chitiniphilus shinanonensis]|uniref:Uncharacterized protein n=2 Tax=Chitiniphilus shinanonensis TaxID=553088 RepID=A0ABQ6BY77_9NEIS|nr:hypothetical protein GCM10007860_35640 [Chitiniphilus shinanonensis]